MSRKQIGLVVALIVVVISIAGIAYQVRQLNDIVITEEEVQSKINAHLPLSANNVTVNKARVSFREGRVNVFISAEGRKFGQPFSLTATSSITVSYDNTANTFHFIPGDIKVSDLKIRGKDVSEGIESTIERVAKSKRLDKVIARLDKYLPAAEFRNELAARKTDIGEKVEDKMEAAIEESAKWLLAKVPIHPPSNSKGYATRMLLESVEITDGKLIAHLSFWQFTKTVIAWILGLTILLIMVVALIAFPEALLIFST